MSIKRSIQDRSPEAEIITELKKLKSLSANKQELEKDNSANRKLLDDLKNEVDRTKKFLQEKVDIFESTTVSSTDTNQSSNNLDNKKPPDKPSINTNVDIGSENTIKKCRLIIKNSEIACKSLEDLNKKHLIGLKALSYKKATIDENTIIIECNLLELDSFLDLKNWKLIHQETKIKVDKFSSYFVTYCVSKVRVDGKLLVNLNDIESNLQSLKLNFIISDLIEKKILHYSFLKYQNM